VFALGDQPEEAEREHQAGGPRHHREAVDQRRADHQ
jgi:hypothetical protein